jgi:phosphoribosylformylglycinamidine (FGAM) synthase PurS component
VPTYTLTLTVALKVTDNEARSALEAIQVKMGLGAEVVGLVREELWEVEVESPSAAEARAIVQRLVETTNLFANPNKHRYALGAAGALDADEAAILVSDRESSDGPAMVATVQRLGVLELVGARKWVRWRVRLAKAPSERDPGVLDLIRRIGVTTTRRDGLLSNPHSQVSSAVLPWGERRTLEE